MNTSERHLIAYLTAKAVVAIAYFVWLTPKRGTARFATEMRPFAESAADGRITRGAELDPVAAFAAAR